MGYRLGDCREPALPLLAWFFVISVALVPLIRKF